VFRVLVSHILISISNVSRETLPWSKFSSLSLSLSLAPNPLHSHFISAHSFLLMTLCFVSTRHLWLSCPICVLHLWSLSPSFLQGVLFIHWFKFALVHHHLLPHPEVIYLVFMISNRERYQQCSVPFLMNRVVLHIWGTAEGFIEFLWSPINVYQYSKCNEPQYRGRKTSKSWHNELIFKLTWKNTWFILPTKMK
jgi:hypothetical protein